MTTFGGTCCRPSALRNRLSTTTILVKEVTITATNGASARLTTVSSTSAGENELKSMTQLQESRRTPKVSPTATISPRPASRPLARITTLAPSSREGRANT